MKPDDMKKVTTGKPHTVEVLPNRMSRTTITKVDVYNRAMGNYDKNAKAPDFGVMLGPVMKSR